MTSRKIITNDEFIFISENFGYIIQAIKGTFGEEEKNTLISCKNINEVFSFLWNLKATHEVISLEKEKEEKNVNLARMSKKSGNEYFNKKAYLSALKEYNRAIIHSPYPFNKDSKVDEEISKMFKIYFCQNEKKTKTENFEESDNDLLAQCYGNRSACLLHLEKWKECILDVERSLHLIEASKPSHKLLHRAGLCNLKLKKFKEAKKYFELALEELKKNETFEDSTRKSWTKTLERCLVQCGEANYEKEQKEEKIFQFEKKSFSISPLSFSSDDFPSSLSLGEAENGQKEARVTEEVSIGERLFSEKPFLSVYFTDRNPFKRCQKCFKKLNFQPIPCFFCAQVSYCSFFCRDEDLRLFHKIQCPFFSILSKGMSGDIGHLTINLLMQVDPKEVLSLNKLERENIGNKNSQLETFEKILSLKVSKWEPLSKNKSSISTEDLVQFVEEPLFCCFLLKFLFTCGFVGCQEKKGSGEADHLKFMMNGESFHRLTGEEVHQLGGVLTRLVRVLKKHALLIRESHGFSDDARISSIGVAIYPEVACYLNQSCDPSSLMTFHGDVAVLRSVKKLRPGDLVSISFGPPFHQQKKELRRKFLLKNRGITCSCEACRSNWPVIEEIFLDSPTYKCQKCGSFLTGSGVKWDGKVVTCGICKNKQNLEQIVVNLQESFDNFAKSMSEAMSGEVEKAYWGFRSHLERLQTHISQPWPDLIATQEALNMCLRLSGNLSSEKGW